jgi:hypothetical protein
MGNATAAAPADTTPADTTLDAPAAAPKRRGRPPKAAGTSASAVAQPARTRATRAKTGKARGAAKIALHDEIVAVIAERGPQTAADLATAIIERGRYQAPRTAKPLDAATVNARVSNPIYRGRFIRRERRIGLASE